MSILKTTGGIALALCAALAVAAAPLWEENFEQPDARWSKSKRWRISGEQAFEGGKSLEILKNCEIRRTFEVKPSTRYRFNLMLYAKNPADFSVTVNELDAKGNSIGRPVYLWGGLVGSGKMPQWIAMPIFVDTLTDTAKLKIAIRNRSAKGGGFIDAIRLEEYGERPMVTPDPMLSEPPGPDALMLPGPDGYMYPNFTAAGLRTPWSLPEKVFKVNDFGAVPGDGRDDTPAIRRAIAAAEQSGGGVVEFGRGDYMLTGKINVRGDRVVLRGIDRKASRIVCTLPENGIGIFSLTGGNVLRGGQGVKYFFPRSGAGEVRVGVNGEVLATFRPEEFLELPDKADYAAVVHRFSKATAEKLDQTSATLFIEVDYAGGRTERSEAEYFFNRFEFKFNVFCSSYITMAPDNKPSGWIRLVEPATRGDRVIKLAEPLAVKPGDVIRLRLAVTPEFRRQLGGNRCPWWPYMVSLHEVAAVEGNTVTLVRRLRRDFPAGSSAIVATVMRRSGVENLTIAPIGEIQIELKMAALVMNGVFDCRVNGITVDRPGTRGVYFENALNCEGSDINITQPWRIKREGLAYTGFERAQDCLMRNVSTYAMRHAPCFNWDCSGCVFTDSTFLDSDAQWHGGWSHDNLIENTRITMRRGGPGGSYGWGFFAVPLEDSGHGVIGPRNVVYNCDAQGIAGGVHMGGMNQQWMIMYNRIHVTDGPGILERFGCRDTTIVGNAFTLDSASSPMIWYESRDNSGDRVIGNLLFGGNGRIFGGSGRPGEAKDNTAVKVGARIGLPRAPVPSLWQWQRQTYCK